MDPNTMNTDTTGPGTTDPTQIPWPLDKISDLKKYGYRYDWPAIILLFFIHIIAPVAFMATFIISLMHYPSLAIMQGIWFLVQGFIGGASTTVYLHRLGSHRVSGGKVSKLVHYLNLYCFNIFALMNDALRWMSQHRIHHKVDDTIASAEEALRKLENYKSELDEEEIKKLENDIRNAQKRRHEDHYSARNFKKTSTNFNWSHWANYLFKHPENPNIAAEERALLKDCPQLKTQKKLYPLLIFIWLISFPLICGYLIASWLNIPQIFGMLAILSSCWMSTFFVHHVTWTVNSLSHLFGDMVPGATTARNNLVLRILSAALGESNHLPHHMRPNDYRNGFDKLSRVMDTSARILRLLEKCKLVGKLHRESDDSIARVNADIALYKAEQKAAPSIWQEHIANLQSLRDGYVEQVRYIAKAKRDLVNAEKSETFRKMEELKEKLSALSKEAEKRWEEFKEELSIVVSQSVPAT